MQIWLGRTRNNVSTYSTATLKKKQNSQVVGNDTAENLTVSDFPECKPVMSLSRIHISSRISSAFPKRGYRALSTSAEPVSAGAGREKRKDGTPFNPETDFFGVMVPDNDPLTGKTRYDG